MRSIATVILSSAAVVVTAMDLTFYSDETCGTTSTEVKGKICNSCSQGSDGVSPASGDVPMDGKIEFGKETVVGGTPGQCVEFGEELELKISVGATTVPSVKFMYSMVNDCTEYGTFDLVLFPKDMKDCVHKKNPTATDPSTMTLRGYTSMCYPVFPGYTSSDEAGENALGMSVFTGMGLYGFDKPVVYYKANCNPAPGDVWAIVLSSLAIVFALASIGLAVVAKGK